MKLYATYLSSAEKTAEHAAAHALLALAVQEQYQMPLPEIQTGAHGKPFFPAYPELHFNLSHCQRLAVCGLDSHPLGIDAEPIRALRPGVLRRAFSPEERTLVEAAAYPDEAFFRLWTKKESLVKALGIGISYPLHTVCFPNLRPESGCGIAPWHFFQYVLQDHWILSCCGQEPDRFPDTILFRTI